MSPPPPLSSLLIRYLISLSALRDSGACRVVNATTSSPHSLKTFCQGDKLNYSSCTEVRPKRPALCATGVGVVFPPQLPASFGRRNPSAAHPQFWFTNREKQIHCELLIGFLAGVTSAKHLVLFRLHLSHYPLGLTFWLQLISGITCASNVPGITSP